MSDDLAALEELYGKYARGDLEPGEILAQVREWRRQDYEREEAQYQRLRDRLQRDDEEGDQA